MEPEGGKVKNPDEEIGTFKGYCTQVVCSHSPEADLVIVLLRIKLPKDCRKREANDRLTRSRYVFSLSLRVDFLLSEVSFSDGLVCVRAGWVGG